MPLQPSTSLSTVVDTEEKGHLQINLGGRESKYIFSRKKNLYIMF